jgi:hypothetical protein
MNMVKLYHAGHTLFCMIVFNHLEPSRGQSFSISLKESVIGLVSNRFGIVLPVVRLVGHHTRS